VSALLLVITRITSLTERTVVGQWFAIVYIVVLVFAIMALYGAQIA
jgi:hypothetical protein